MCYPVTCPSCGKVGWGGCGAHVDQVMRNVAPDQRCVCREKKQSEASRVAERAGAIPERPRGAR